MKLTIFTPTYNRANLLPNLYDSLVKQASPNFIWLIVDDGSTDNTKELVDQFKQHSKFPIEYIYQENQGKHIAINTALDFVNTEYFVTVDSDDLLKPNALDIIDQHLPLISEDNTIGIASPIEMIGNSISAGKKISYSDCILCSPIEMEYKHNIRGEFTLIFKTQVAKLYKYPVFQNEKFMRESLVFNRMAKKYKFLYIPEAIVEAEYLNDGLTHNIKKNLSNSPKGATLAFKELMNNKRIPISRRITATLSFWDFATLDNQSFIKKLMQIKGVTAKILFLKKKYIK